MRISDKHADLGNIVDKPLADGLPGEAIIYFSGDRIRATRDVKLARTLYNAGRVELVQKRNPSGYMDYLAIFRYSINKRLPDNLKFKGDHIR